MAIKENHNPYRIYIKATHEWVEVSEEIYREHTRYYDAFRKRHQAHGQCVCPKNKFWLCDGDCCHCEFRRAGDMLSLDYETEDEDGDTCTPLDMLEDTHPLAEMSRKGHTAEIRALIQKYGADKLSGVDPAHYRDLLTEVEGLDHAE